MTKTQRLVRLLGGAVVCLSAAVFVSTLLVAAAQFFGPAAGGFMHQYYDAQTRTLRRIDLTPEESGLWFDWAYHHITSPEYHDRWSVMMRDRPRWWERFDPPQGYGTDNIRFGFYFNLASNSSRQRYLIFRVPYWFVAAATAVPPALVLRRLLRDRRRRRRGLCVRCGYDLRGSQQTCPECGTSVVPAPAATS